MIDLSSSGAFLEHHLKRQRAHSRVHAALRNGQLARGACERRSENCQGQIEGHHENYDLPLKVTWLCRRHHLGRHIELRTAA